jgi:hypothetical protein
MAALELELKSPWEKPPETLAQLAYDVSFLAFALPALHAFAVVPDNSSFRRRFERASELACQVLSDERAAGIFAAAARNGFRTAAAQVIQQLEGKRHWLGSQGRATV